MAIEIFNRYEHKYILQKEIFQKVIEIVDAHMELDPHNKCHKTYPISNIYFDTDDDYLIRTSISKPAYKEKLRLRSYGVPDGESKVYLEIKKKYNGLVNKRRTEIKLNEAYEFIKSGNVQRNKEYMNSQVVNEITYFLSRYKLKPKVYLAYDRIAYFEKGNPDLRISFDTNIRSRRYDVHLEDGDYGKALMKDDIYLMEIKTSYAMPLWLTEMLTDLGIRRQNFSKYGTEYKKYVKNRR